ncbi:hypothetical protein G6F56_004552 [Rhizopus delemar]|nr:hypothetical protein G6F56_004552 [Rhizopus delemar]
MKLVSLPEKIIVNITRYLELRDIVELGQVNVKLNQCLYKEPAIWTKHILFPANNSSITDDFIRKTIPKITRRYGILDIQMIDLPLTWFGYFLIFDQFAHSLASVRIQSDHLFHLLHHLTQFAINLASLQQENQIPCTFREYAFEVDPKEPIPILKPLPKTISQIKLDDPPFERLNHVSITSQVAQDELVSQLEILFSFLSGFKIRSKRARS